MTGESNRPRALVTGASSGLGEVFAEKLAKKGYNLIVTARRKDRLDALAESLELLGSTTTVIEADLATDAGVDLLVEPAAEVDLLVNNAGFGSVGEFAELPVDRELDELNVNVRALMKLCHVALGAMMERKRGSIINVASTAAFQPIPYNATYSATKAFVLHFSEALHEEVKKHGVAVTCLCPGPVKTEFQEVAGVNDGTVPDFMWTTAESVVDAALAALNVRRAYVVPGPMNAMTAFGVSLAPRFVTRKIAAAFFRDRASQYSSPSPTFRAKLGLP